MTTGNICGAEAPFTVDTVKGTYRVLCPRKPHGIDTPHKVWIAEIAVKWSDSCDRPHMTEGNRE